MKILKERRVPLQSKTKVMVAMKLFEKYVDEPISKIEFWGSVMYTFNDRWSVDISNNSVERTYPDPEY